MNTLTKQHRAELMDLILQVAMNCPVEHTNPVDCPLHGVRDLNLPERLAWFYRLTDDDLCYLSSYHSICSRHKRLTRNPELLAV